jgi:hypothetical protein
MMKKTTVEALVTDFFQGDQKKMKLWFASANPLLGGMSPQEMIAMGRGNKVFKFVKTQLEQNERPS